MAVKNISDVNFQKELNENNKVVVKYYADWCGSCKLFAPKYKRLSNDERFTDITFLEVNAEENEKARKAANVDNLPFFAIFKDGDLVEGSAMSKEEAFVALLEKLN